MKYPEFSDEEFKDSIYKPFATAYLFLRQLIWSRYLSI